MNLSKLILFFIYFIAINGSAQYSVSGIVTEKESQKPLIGVSIKTENRKGTVTNSKGRYTIILSQGKNKISYSFVGYETKTFNLFLDKDFEKNISLSEVSTDLDLMVVSASKFKQKIEEVTVSMDVIGSKFIESKNCITLSDVIRNAPSIQLIDGQLNIRSGSGWSYGTGSRVLVMVDEMPILSADQGEVDFNLIPIETIEQI